VEHPFNIPQLMVLPLLNLQLQWCQISHFGDKFPSTQHLAQSNVTIHWSVKKS